MRTTKPASVAVTTIMSLSSHHSVNSLPLSASKPAILCLHGRQQNAASFALKISGARKKLSRIYECDFLDGPISIPSPDGVDDKGVDVGRAWWSKTESGQVVGLEEAFHYVSNHIQLRREKGEIEYSAILGFSQGGTLASLLAMSQRDDIFPNLAAVVTAGSPMVEEAVECASVLRKQRVVEALSPSAPSVDRLGTDVPIPTPTPMLHFAGETDGMVPVDSTRRLCEAAGGGEVRVHERGHMFPTRAAEVRVLLDFLDLHVDQPES